MRIFSYRNKRALRRALLIALLAVVLIGLLILARISYLGRYAVYSPDGVYFDKTQKLQREDVPAAAPAADPEEYPFETILSASSGEEETGPDTVQLQGYYISTTMLANSVDEVRQALEAGADVIMLDNMDCPTMAKAVKLVNGRAKLEASGNVTMENIREVAESGVDIISLGALTHSVKAFDISMKWKK